MYNGANATLLKKIFASVHGIYVTNARSKRMLVLEAKADDKAMKVECRETDAMTYETTVPY